MVEIVNMGGAWRPRAGAVYSATGIVALPVGGDFERSGDGVNAPAMLTAPGCVLTGRGFVTYEAAMRRFSVWPGRPAGFDGALLAIDGEGYALLEGERLILSAEVSD